MLTVAAPTDTCYTVSIPSTGDCKENYFKMWPHPGRDQKFELKHRTLTEHCQIYVIYNPREIKFTLKAGTSCCN